MSKENMKDKLLNYVANGTDDPFVDVREEKIICSECGEECGSTEETFDYAGTHCTNGKSGTHHTGVYVSDCCFAEMELADEP